MRARPGTRNRTLCYNIVVPATETWLRQLSLAYQVRRPDVTAVTAILIRPATTVETPGIGRSVGRSEFGLHFLAAIVILGRVRLQPSLTRTLP